MSLETSSFSWSSRCPPGKIEIPVEMSATSRVGRFGKRHGRYRGESEEREEDVVEVHDRLN